MRKNSCGQRRKVVIVLSKIYSLRTTQVDTQPISNETILSELTAHVQSGDCGKFPGFGNDARQI